MKVQLMYKDKHFEVKKQSDRTISLIINDLELERILDEMSSKDGIIYTACRDALLNPLMLIEDIYYRQDNLSDALNNPNSVKLLYQITIDTEAKRKSSWRWFSSNYLAGTYSSAVELLGIYLEMLMELRAVADNCMDHFHSEGFRNLLIMLQHELDDDYFELAKSQIDDLKHSDGTLISSEMGNYLQGINYVLRKREKKGFWSKWLFAPSYTIAPRDDSGAKDIEKRRERAINEATNALAQATEHLEGFFTMLRRELAFYIGCINLAEKINKTGMPICIPTIGDEDIRDRISRELYDVSLLLLKNTKIVGNDLNAKTKNLYLITGANQGGKSTFLRSIGQAQLMAQCGMFVGASEYSVPIRNGIFTHFKREEDKTLTSGKLDEELGRMSEIVEGLDKNALVLLNESFAATNEREGSEISYQITKALNENSIEVFSVTHLYMYASSFINGKNVQFLRAQRLENGERTYKIEEGIPLQTAFGEDLYIKIFGC